MAQILALLAGNRSQQPMPPAPVIAPSTGVITYGPRDHADPDSFDHTGGDDKSRRKPRKPKTAYEKKMDAAAIGGPSKYTPVMRRNLGMGNRSVGYGDRPVDNTSGYTQLVNLLAPTPAPQVQQPAPQFPPPQGPRPMETY
jgi:hypothetical protein